MAGAKTAIAHACNVSFESVSDQSLVGPSWRVELVNVSTARLGQSGALTLADLGLAGSGLTSGQDTPTAEQQSISKIDSLVLKQRAVDGSNVAGLVVFRVEPTRNDFRFMKSRTGSTQDASAPGRIALTDAGRVVVSWRFDRGAAYALGSRAILPGSPGDVLLILSGLRRG